MDTYKRSIEEVDIALARLNATLQSYRVSTAAKAAGAAEASSASSSARKPVNGASQHSTTTRAPPAVRGLFSHADKLREKPQQVQDPIWKATLDLRQERAEEDDVDEPEAIPAIEPHQLQRTLDDVSRIQRHFLIQNPYLLPLRLLLAQKYMQLGYPDLSAGEAYKCLLLCDAVGDTADEYHGPTAAALRDLIQQIPLVERIRLLKGELHADKHPPTREPGEDMDVEVDVWVREHYLPLSYRLLCMGLFRLGCYKDAHTFAHDARAKGYGYDLWISDIWQACPEAVERLGHDRDTISNKKSWPNSGLVRREVYPWNEWEPDRMQELPLLNEMMASVAPKLEIRAVELPGLADGDSDSVMQLGVFAKGDISPGEVILEETSMLTANNKLQDALCDACSADLPGLDEEGGDNVRQCQYCDVVFCSQDCLERAEKSYHVAVCGADLDALLRDVPPKEAADSLYALLLLRTIAMSEAQGCHPLELKEVRFIWGDFHNISVQDHFQPPSMAWAERSQSLQQMQGNLPVTLPFSFDHNIRLPLQMLEKMEINPFTEHKFDVWVFNTLYAKFRGTASARLSGLGGRAVRGPEVSAVHPMWCMANHSCDPNVDWEWGGSIKFWARQERVAWTRADGTTEVKSSAGIKKGEEILNHYCDVDLPVNERREWARGALGGDCRCDRCMYEAGDRT